MCRHLALRIRLPRSSFGLFLTVSYLAISPSISCSPPPPVWRARPWCRRGLPCAFDLAVAALHRVVHLPSTFSTSSAFTAQPQSWKMGLRAALAVVCYLAVVALAADTTDIHLTILQRMSDSRVNKDDCPAGQWKTDKCAMDTNWKVSGHFTHRPTCPHCPHDHVSHGPVPAARAHAQFQFPPASDKAIRLYPKGQVTLVLIPSSRSLSVSVHS